MSDPDFKLVKTFEQSIHSKVVCEGQNRISERILWGDLDTFYEVIPNVARKIFADFKIDNSNIPPDYLNNLVTDESVLPLSFKDDIKMTKIRELSMQQAVDLACLLMRIEKDIQKYTENIPTVGGNVKIAIIDDDGFKFILGEQIIPGTF